MDSDVHLIPDPSFPAAHFFMWCEAERSRRAWDTTELCRCAGVPVSTYTALKDSTEQPRYEVVARFALLLEIPVLEAVAAAGLMPVLPGASDALRREVVECTVSGEEDKKLLLWVIDVTDDWSLGGEGGMA